MIWIGFAFKKKQGLRETISRFVKTAFAAGLLHHWDDESDHSYHRWGKILAQLSRCKNEKELMKRWLNATRTKARGLCTHWHVHILGDIVREGCISKLGSQREGAGSETYLHMVHLKLVFSVYAVSQSIAIGVFGMELMLKYLPLLILRLNCTIFHIRKGIPTIKPRLHRMVSSDSTSSVVPFTQELHW